MDRAANRRKRLRALLLRSTRVAPAPLRCRAWSAFEARVRLSEELPLGIMVPGVPSAIVTSVLAFVAVLLLGVAAAVVYRVSQCCM